MEGRKRPVVNARLEPGGPAPQQDVGVYLDLWTAEAVKALRDGDPDAGERMTEHLVQDEALPYWLLDMKNEELDAYLDWRKKS